ncbi:MAG: preprotein translocase subunit SecE [Spirulina sp. DLM2.Bin59]|nr:MAG: preprotein translocase subunit SecE [Spirulina sp. DLM2.Bin59]
MAKKDVKADQTPKGSAPNTKDKNEPGTPGFSLMGFLTESKSELGKVVWPSRQQLISESAAVILMVTLVATTIYFVDNLFEWISQSVFS